MKKLDARTVGCPVAGLRAVVGATLFAFALTACGTTSNPPPPNVAELSPDLSKVEALQNDVLADGKATITVVVTALDTNGNPMSDQTVQLSVEPSSNAVTVSQPPQPTDADGKAMGTIACSLPGKYTVRATVSDSALTQTLAVNFAAVVSPATKLVFTQAPQKKGLVANAPIQPTIKVAFKDDNGNIVRSETRTIKLSLSFNPTSALLEGTLEKAAVQGVAEFTDLTINKPGDGYEMQAVVVPNASTIKAVKSDPFEMTVGTATRLVVSSRQTAEVGVPIQLEVMVKDAYDNTVTGYTGTVRFETSDGQMCGSSCTCCGNSSCGSDPACQVAPVPEYTFTADDKGVKDFTSQRKAMFKTAGPAQTYSVFDKADSAVNGSISVRVHNGPPTRIAVSGVPVSPATVTAGDFIDFTVSLYDAYGNVVQDPPFEGRVYFEVPTDSNAETPGQYQFVSPANGGSDLGTHSFVGGLRLKTAMALPGHTFTAAVGGSSVLTRITGIVVVPQSQIGGLAFISSPPDPVTARVGFGFKVAIQDAFQNTITSKTNAITISIDQMGVTETGTPPTPVNGHLTGTLSIPAVAGVATWGTNLQIDANGVNYKLKASMVDGGTTYSQSSGAFTVVDNTAPSPVSNLTLTATATTIVMNWTSVGDDGVAGQAARYTITYCPEATCAGGANIDSLGTIAPNPPTPKVAGQPETYTITGLNAATKYYVQLTVTDDAYPTPKSTPLTAAKNATTSPCPTGYTGPTCGQCATGYTEDPNHTGTCVNFCVANPQRCNTPPLADCSGNSVRTYDAQGTCAPAPAGVPGPNGTQYFTCSYTSTQAPCGTGDICYAATGAAASCVADPCAGVSCPAVAPICTDGVTLKTTAVACQAQNGTTPQCVATETTRSCTGTTPVCYKGSASADVANCVAAAVAPTAGSLTVTEMMLTPSGSNAKWIELKNLTNSPISLEGLVATETVANKTVTLPATERIEANGYYVIASAAITGVNAGTRVYVWSGLSSVGTSGHFTFVKGTTTAEDFTYGSALAGTSGTAMQLSSVFQVSKANLNSWYWCAATAPIGTSSDLGTPGQDNGACSLTRPADFSASMTCAIDRPTVIPDASNGIWPAEVGVATKVYGRFSDPGVTTLNTTTGNDNYPFVEGQLGFGPTGTDPSAGSWSWRAGTFNGAYTASGDSDEMVADLIPTANGNVLYAWRFRVVPAVGSPAAWVYCDRVGRVAATPPASTNYAQANVRTGPAQVSTQINAVKAASDGSALNLLVDGAVVTYIRTFVGDFPGFFVQAEASGPALWINLPPSSVGLTPALAVGDKISFTVTGKRTLSSGVKEVYAISNVSRVSPGNPIAALTADFSSKTDTVTTLSASEFRMVKTSGILAADLTSADAGYVKARFDTMGINGTTNTLQVARFPADVATGLSLGKNCRLTITAPLWRGKVGANAEAEFTAWTADDVTGVNCSPVVISQAYGAGGNTGATFNQDYVELHNRTDASVTLTGWALQYSASTATTASWTVNALPTVTLPAGGYYLVALATGSNGVALSPAADFTPTSNPINMSGTTGKIALTTTTTALAKTPPTVTSTIADLVGFGAANYYEGAAPAPAQTATGASIRANSGCTDWDQNGTDFTTGTPAPRNAATPAFICQ